MTFSKTATTAVVCTSLLAGNLAFAPTSAEARDWRGDRGAYGYQRNAPRYYAPPHRPRYAAPEHRRDNNGKKIVTGIAIGIGALILGSIIADSAKRR